MNLCLLNKKILNLSICLNFVSCNLGKEKVEEKTASCSAFDGGLSSIFQTVGAKQKKPWTQFDIVTAPAGRLFHSLVSIDQNMFVWGGLVGGLEPGYSDSGAVYRPLSDSWIPTPSTEAPSARFAHCAVSTGSGVFVWGGEGADGLLADGGLFDSDSNTWTSLSSTGAPSGRMWHSCHYFENKVYVWGGVSGDDSQTLANGAIYDLTNKTWQEMSASGAQPFVASLFGTSVVLTDGILFYNALAGSLSLYRLSSDEWSSLSMTDGPDLRYGFAAHLSQTGDDLFVWGGAKAASGEALADFFSYKVSTDEWSALNLTSGPSARLGATMSVIDDSLYVWGGWSIAEAKALASGSAYSLDSKTWSDIDTSDAPAARVLHHQIQIGQSYIIWGGTSFLPTRESGDEAISFLRNQSKLAITETALQIEKTLAEGEEAVSDLKDRIGDISLALNYCPLTLTDENLHDFLFLLAPGGGGAEYDTEIGELDPQVDQAPGGTFVSGASMIEPIENLEQEESPEVKKSKPNCWNPFP